MKMENGIVVGTIGNKYSSKNPIARHLVRGFDNAVGSMASATSPKSILEIGCGEGHVTQILLNQTRAEIHATELSASVLKETKQRITDPRITWDLAKLEDYRPNRAFDLVVCCEVLEHLPNPDAGLRALQAIDAAHILLSVPNEPIWRVLNFSRGQYFRQFGNSPGHIQHWSTRQFVKLVSAYFSVVEVQTPLPWSVVLCKKS